MRIVKELHICNSNMFVPVTLTEVLKNPNCQYLIISDTENIKKIFELFNIPNISYYHYGFNPKADGYLGFIKKRKELFDYVMHFKIDQVVFYHAEFGAMANWLINKLSKLGIPIKYCKIYDSMNAPKAPLSLQSIKLWLSEYIYWGQNMEILQQSYLIPSLPHSFYRKVNAEQITRVVDGNVVSKFISEKLDMNIRGSYLLLTGTAVKANWYREKEYTVFINRLIDYIGSDNIISKCHPRFSDLYGKEKELRQIPSFIPGNLLIENFNCFIGIESTLLVEAAKEGKIAISIIELLPMDEQLKKIQKDYFVSRLQGKGVIFYPKSMAELKEILKLD